MYDVATLLFLGYQTS